MSILLQTQHTNMGTAHRIIRMVVGVSIIIGCAIAAINYSPLVDGMWFAALMWPAAYLMFTGFTGVGPFGMPQKQKNKCRNPQPPIGPFIVHTS